MGGFVTVFSGASGVCSAWGWGPLRHCCCPHDPRITPVPLAFSGFSVALYIYAAPLALVLAITLALSALRFVILCCCGVLLFVLCARLRPQSCYQPRRSGVCFGSPAFSFS